MYYKYIDKTNKLFKQNETYKIDYVPKYDKYVCSDNMKILSPNDVYTEFRKVYLDKDSDTLFVENDDRNYDTIQLKKMLIN